MSHPTNCYIILKPKDNSQKEQSFALEKALSKMSKIMKEEKILQQYAESKIYLKPSERKRKRKNSF